ncbi:MAG: amidase [Rhodospirillales bacterium]|nr:amidase [Rhodospirillales bacterium]MDE2576641.1 amidase [Rhodospirillales bacterium]
MSLAASSPADLSLVEAAEAVRRRAVSAVGLLEACLARLDTVNPTINATIWIDRERAFAAAEAADRALAAGAGTGPLHGVPLAHKDMFYQAGRRCTCGSAIRRDFVPDRTATVITRLAEAGAHAFAGLNMAEFALNPTGHNRAFGDCRNPWNPAHITGGSSSGSGAAVASGAVLASLGSDTGGSVRLPAAACGVTGLKPTQGRVSRHGVMPLSFSADNVGPLARSARDCARMMAVIAGHDLLDPTSSTEPVPDYEAALDGDVRGLRVGVPTDVLTAGADAGVLAAMEAALDVLAARGAVITRLALPLMPAIAAYAGLVSRAEASAIHARFMRARPQDYAVHLSARLYAGYAIPATAYIEALAQRGPLLRAFAGEVFGAVDVLACPTIPTALPTRAETDIDHGPPGTEHRFMAVSVNTRPFNYLGLPAISLPCGFDAGGLPVGLQLAGRPFGEARLLKIADAYQRDTDWHRRRPPLSG